jgi:hypothetical protein
MTQLLSVPSSTWDAAEDNTKKRLSVKSGQSNAEKRRKNGDDLTLATVHDHAFRQDPTLAVFQNTRHQFNFEGILTSWHNKEYELNRKINCYICVLFFGLASLNSCHDIIFDCADSRCHKLQV